MYCAVAEALGMPYGRVRGPYGSTCKTAGALPAACAARRLSTR